MGNSNLIFNLDFILFNPKSAIGALALTLLTLLGRFDELNQRDDLFFGCLAKTAIPLFLREFCPKPGLHVKIRLPAHNSSRTGDIATLF